MKYLISLAFKNIFRQKRRTILTFLVLTVGIALYILMTGIIEGYKKQSVENFINFDTGHIKIRSQNYDEDSQFAKDNILADYRKVETVLSSKSYIKAFTERLSFTGEADNGRDSTPCIVIGINLLKDKTVFDLEKYISSGSLNETGAVLGKNLAGELGLAVGDSVFITFRNIDGMYDSVELPISGLITSGDPMVNNVTVFADIKTVSKLMNTDGVTDISIVTENYTRSQKYADDLQSALGGYQVLTWQNLSEAIVAAMAVKEKSASILIIFILIIAFIGIINTMLLSVYEKIREIGTLKALGMRDRDIQMLFTIEGTIIGISGGLTGVLSGALINWYFVTVGYDISIMLGKESDSIMAAYRLMGVMRATWNIPSIVLGFTMCIIVSIAASFYPAKKATRLQAAESLRINQ